MLDSASIMRPEVQALVRLQELDQSTARLEAEMAELPKRLDALQKEGAAQAKQMESLKSRLQGDESERRKLEGNVELHKSKIVKLKKQLLEAQNQTQYQALEHEITWAESEIEKSDERMLELLLEEEQLKEEIASNTTKLATMQKHFEEERVAALARHKGAKAEITAAGARRQEVLGTLTPQMASLYERLKKKHKNGLVAVEAVNAQCQGCFMELRPQIWQELRSNHPFMTCEHCGRVLYVHSTTGFDAQMGPAPVL